MRKKNYGAMMLILWLMVGFLPAEEKPEAVLRVNCGAKETTRLPNGDEWLADQSYRDGQWGYVGGSVAERKGSMAIENTAIGFVYRSERYGLQQYKFHLPKGQYTLFLHFAETTKKAEDEFYRVFSVAVQGQKALSAFSPFKAAGGLCKATVQRVPDVRVGGDGLLTIDFVEFCPPLINGIEIYKGDIKETHGDVKAAPLDVEKGIRINCGGGVAMKDSQGKEWMADQVYANGGWGYVGGDAAEREESMKIENTERPFLYQSERYGLQGYRFHLPKGEYEVLLHFAETSSGIASNAGELITKSVKSVSRK